MADLERAPQGPGRAAPTCLVLASYNVHGCVGRDGRRDAERIAAVLAELDADVVALQEVDSRGGARGADPLAVLGEATGMAAIAGPTLLSDDGHYGNAVLTSLPVRRVARLDLSHPGREPRGALDLDLDSGAGVLRLIATHLGLRARERAAQLRHLQAAIGARSAPLLAVLGDMNDWLPGRLGLRPLRALLGPSPAPRTFPAHRPLLPLDRVWVRPGQALVEVRVHRSPLARVASDHLPLCAVVRHPGAAGLQEGESACA